MTGSGADVEADQAPWAPQSACPRDTMSARDYVRCLFDATRTSEHELEVALAKALNVIAQRTDLAPVQRNAWRNLLEEAQSRFLLFRNFDCQSVAPFEGARGIGNFEQRSLCLITANRARAQALDWRYSVSGPQANAEAEGPWPQSGIWVFPGRPLVE